MACWRPGDLLWNKIDIEKCGEFRNIHYLKGQFYMITGEGDVVWVIDVARFNNKKPRLVVKVKNCDLHWPYKKQFYLVEVSAALLFVIQYSGDDRLVGSYFQHNRTYLFHVWELDLIKGEAKRIKLLRDRAILLGCNASISMEPSKFIGVKPNHIYYTDNYKELYTLSRLSIEEMSSYNLKEGTNKPTYSSINYFDSTIVNPPTWIIPSL